MAISEPYHLYGEMMEIQATVRETVTVGVGNLMILNSLANMVINSNLSGASTTADNYAYPIAACAPIAGMEANVGARLLGVALDSSSQVTKVIAIATAGVFRFPLNRKSAVTLGSVVSGNTRGPFALTSNNTRAYQLSARAAGVSVGYCVRTQSGASNVDVLLRTMTGPGGVIA